MTDRNAPEPIERPAYVYAGTFDEWFSLNRAAVADYASELAMASLDGDDDDSNLPGLMAFARVQYDIERAARGLPSPEPHPLNECYRCGCDNKYGEFEIVYRGGLRAVLCDDCYDRGY